MQYSQFSLHHLNSFSFMFVGTDSWNTDLKCIFFEVQFREIPNEESLKTPTYASAW